MYANHIKVIPRKTREEILRERKIEKEVIAADLSHTDRKEIYRQMNTPVEGIELVPISYGSVANALNPNHQFWSERVIAFAKAYIKARKEISHDNK
jgi:hypothetical protein